MKIPRWVWNWIYTVLLMGAGFGLCLVFYNVLQARSLVPMLMVLTVYLVSLLARGYTYGIVASLISVLVVNYVYSFPVFAFNFTSAENITTAIVTLIVTTLTTMLTNKIKNVERMQNERDLEKMRANLLRAVSHDLRTPLTTIYGASSAMIEDYDSFNREQVLELASGIQEDAEWLMRMVENLLSVTRFDSTGVMLTMTPTVLEELIDTVLVKFNKRYPRQPVQVSIPEEFVSIPMDAVLIGQVLTNLLENAVQHAVGMENLWLRVTLDGNKAVFQVADDGCGIPPELREKVFAGYRGEENAPGDSKKRNMGIGLSVCASIIKAHGSRITLHQRDGGGALFQFELELEED